MGAEMMEKDRDMGQNIMIQTVNVSKTFSGKEEQVEALKNISLDIYKEDIFGIIGMSGAGKSTVTTAFLEKGYRLMADDMAFVEVKGDGIAMASPAFPYQKLCRDAALAKGYRMEDMIYIDEEKDKFLVPCTGVFQREKARLERFVFLGIRWKKEAEDKSGKIKAEKITGPDSMIVYKDNLFLRHLWKKQDPGMEIWQNCLKIAEQIPVFWIRRPAAGDSTAEVAAEVHALRNVVSA